MRAEYIITFDDFKAAQHLCRHRNQRAWLSFIFWYRAAPILGLLALAAFIYGLQHIGTFPAWLGGVFAASAWLGIFPLLWWPVQIRIRYRRLREGHAVSEPVELELAGNELVSRRPGLSEGRFQWAAIHEYAEDDRIALIFVRKRLFIPIPRRALDDSGWQALRQWLGSKVRSQLGSVA